MKRIHPLFSLLSLTFAALIFAGLVFIMWRNGNMLFSPGHLSGKSLTGVLLGGFASHAEFESQCQRCHAPLETTQDVLCMDCHTKVEEQILDLIGTHGRIEDVNQCAACHPDHKGMTYDSTLPAMQKFDHSVADFSLKWHQLDYDRARIACTACHSFVGGFSVSSDKCAECHAVHDQTFALQHIQDFGENCLDCHDGHDRMTSFDHSQSAFPLLGKHALVACADCHRISLSVAAPLTRSFESTPFKCHECHAEPQSHLGLFGVDCADCHTPEAWVPAGWQGFIFEHTAETSGFSLERHAVDFEGMAIVCTNCHIGGVQGIDLQTCITCHSNGDQNLTFMNEHTNQFGFACLDCHDGVDRMSDFNHAQFFPLDGAHAELICQTCHQDQAYLDAPTECVGCHAEPEVHAGDFGQQCQFCHTVTAWQPAELQVHSFPLDHGEQGEVACQTCHPDKYVEYTCYGCHDHQPDPIRQSHVRENISLEALPSCVECHPTGERSK